MRESPLIRLLFFLCHRRLSRYVAGFCLGTPGSSHRTSLSAPVDTPRLSAGSHCCFSPPRLSMLLIREQERELSEVTKELKARREVSLLLKERLEVLLGRGHPATSKGRGLRQGLAEGLRLAEQLVHILNPGGEASGPNYAELLSLPGSRDYAHRVTCLTSCSAACVTFRAAANSAVPPWERGG